MLTMCIDMKKTILILLTFLTAIFMHAGKLGETETTTVVFPEVFIENEEISDFCKTTLIPMLRERNFNMRKNVFEMLIEKERGNWIITFNIANWGCLENEDFPQGYSEGFCMIGRYPMKVEFPSGCPFIRVGDRRLSLVHDEGILGVDGCITWYYLFKDGKLIPDRFWGLGEYDVVEGKKMNQSTGRLE